MGDGIITRRGGTFTLQTIAPTITKVSETGASITFTITNNDAETAVILYEIGDTTPDANSIELAAAATSGSITISGLNRSFELTLYATANTTRKIKSNVTEVVYDVAVFTAATGGTVLEYDDGGRRYKSHTFTSNGTFEVTAAGTSAMNLDEVDYLIIAGGAGNTANCSNCGGGGGGGAGGYRTTLGTSGRNSSARDKVTVTATSYGVTIGAGGSGADSGLPSSVDFSSTISTVGGGRGGGGFGANPNDGGSGGGGGAAAESKLGANGTANEGFGGGNNTVGSPFLAGGGGGAGEAGANATGSVSGKGGDGLANTLRDGTSETRAGGGGGGGSSTDSENGLGGAGGGGNGGNSSGPTVFGISGEINTGSGGGGGSNATNGGSGIVVIRYEIAPSV